MGRQVMYEEISFRTTCYMECMSMGGHALYENVSYGKSCFVSGKPILTADKYYSCSKSDICTNEQWKKSPQENHQTKIIF